MSLLTKIAVLLALVFLVDRSSACSCLFNHPQQAYCDGALAFGFRVVGKSRVNVTIDLRPTDPSGLIEFPAIYEQEMVRYLVIGFRLYQGNDQYNHTFPDVHYIYTRTSSAACGVYLKLFSSYVVIGGSYRDGRMEVFSCNHIYNRNQMPYLQQFFLAMNLAFRYDEGCKCTIKNCNFENCVDPRPGNECYTSDLNGLSVPNTQTTCKPYKRSCLWNDGFSVIQPKPQTTRPPLVPKSTVPSLE